MTKEQDSYNKNLMVIIAAVATLGRLLFGFAQALLSKSYLYQKKYGSAQEFQKVIDSHEYSLLPSYAGRLRINNEFGSESLFEAIKNERILELDYIRCSFSGFNSTGRCQQGIGKPGKRNFLKGSKSRVLKLFF